MPPYKVNFSDDGTESALLDIIFDTLEVTSQEIETVLRDELEKHKGKTPRNIIAQASWADRPEDDSRGLPLPDYSRSITYYQKERKAFTACELSGTDNVIRETSHSFYRISTVQTHRQTDPKEFLVLQVLFKESEFAMREIYEVLFEAAAEWIDVNQYLYLLALRGDRHNPMSWAAVGGGGEPTKVQYDPHKRIFTHEGKVIGKAEDGRIIMAMDAGRPAGWKPRT
ncbi:MAG: hypothetical protein JWM68_3728 [Verrucomicrobiales bacterium]|nr:hypothetical protein [Verrucomicrobiales bacterium]